MVIAPAGLDLSEAVQYHYGRFPPELPDYRILMKPLSSAAAALARYDQMLKGMHNSDILLAPLRSQEAVVSSRMEGTISTLDEVLRYEAEKEGDGVDEPESHFRSEAIEVHLYSRAMRFAQEAVRDGAPLSDWLIRSTHKQLLSFGRGASMSPGMYKTEQNYLADRARRKVLFIPISPDQLQSGMDLLIGFMKNDEWEVLLRAALMHLEFEALHPFKDGNGRIGRMLIPLMLWTEGAISQPYFYMSGYLEQRRDDYIDLMRNVSQAGDWTGWIVFFLQAIESQANENLSKAESIRQLYEQMKEEFRIRLASQWSVAALDFVFKRPVFRNNVFTSTSGIPAQTAHRFSKLLSECGVLRTIVPAAGRRPAVYSFEPLLAIVRS
ncbi:Fic family protein [Allostella vacuolata]|nr:Fic family protein [Stella vacuolata]